MFNPVGLAMPIPGLLDNGKELRQTIDRHESLDILCCLVVDRTAAQNPGHITQRVNRTERLDGSRYPLIDEFSIAHVPCQGDHGCTLGAQLPDCFIESSDIEVGERQARARLSQAQCRLPAQTPGSPVYQYRFVLRAPHAPPIWPLNLYH